MEKEKVIEAVLNEPLMDSFGKNPRQICIRCCNVQTHSKVSCYNCGQDFQLRKDGKAWTVLQVMELYQLNYYVARKYSVYYPKYIYAVWKDKLEPAGVTEKIFTDYLSEKIQQQALNK